MVEDEFDPSGEPFTVSIDGILDLHPFDPKDVKDILSEYLVACREKGIFDVKIIHGKGTGSLRRTVHALLGRMPEVASFDTAGASEGGWGSTFVALKPIGESGE